MSILTLITAHNLPNSIDPLWHWNHDECSCEFAKVLRERKMTEEEREAVTLFGTQPTRIPVGDVIRAKRIGFGRLEQMRIDQVSREERLKWIHRVESAITWLQSFRAGASQSLDIELYELNEEKRAKRLQQDQAYKVKLQPEIPRTDKKAKDLANALETLGLSLNDLKKLKG